MNKKLKQVLLELRRADEQTRARLVESGSIFRGYAPDMERVHLQNARRLEQIIAEHGWPGLSLVGEEGATAAWLVAQHAISWPVFQRRCLDLLHDAVRSGEALPCHEAYLVDRIRFNERRPQLYGTIFDWDETGQLSPWTIESPETLEDRRATVGLSELPQEITRVRTRAEGEHDQPPSDYHARQREMENWARQVGWIC